MLCFFCLGRLDEVFWYESDPPHCLNLPKNSSTEMISSYSKENLDFLQFSLILIFSSFIRLNALHFGCYSYPLTTVIEHSFVDWEAIKIRDEGCYNKS